MTLSDLEIQAATAIPLAILTALPAVALQQIGNSGRVDPVPAGASHRLKHHIPARRAAPAQNRDRCSEKAILEREGRAA